VASPTRLGTLATGQRQRAANIGDRKARADALCKVFAVLDMEDAILTRYRAVATNPAQPLAAGLAADAASGLNNITDYRTMQAVCAGLTYKYHVIRLNCVVMQLHETQASGRSVEASPAMTAIPPILRSMMHHEISNDFGFEQQQVAFTLSMLDRSPTLANLARTTDSELIKIQLVGMSYLSDAKPAGGQPDVIAGGSTKAAHKVCRACGTKEPMRGDFKSCGLCKKVHYCGSACQKGNWKEHKKACRESNKP
jgi:hypothetical protein